MRVLTAEAEMEEQVSYDCIAGGNHGDAKVHAVAAHDKTAAAHELGREIEKTARAILRVNQATSSNYIGKLAPSPGRKAFLRLHRSSELTTEEQEPFLTMICLSPDGAAWACLVSERVLRDQFPEAHDVIALSSEWSWHYSSINGIRFVAGEDAIRRSPTLWRKYAIRWGLGSGGGSGTPGAPGATGAPGAGKAGAAP